MISRVTVSRILRDNLGLRQYTRQWVPHYLIKAQKVWCVLLSRSLQESLRLHHDTEFKSLTTEDESWLSYGYQDASVYALSREEVPLMVRNTIGTSKVTNTVFFEAERLICVDTRDPNETFTQDHFTTFVLFDLKKHAQDSCRRQHSIELAVSMDNWCFRKGQKALTK
jgi:hypothetical protein